MIIKKIYNSSAFSSWFSLCIKIIGQIITIPLLYRNYDSEYISYWFVLYSIYAVNIVVDFGLSQTISRFATYSLINNENKEKFEYKFDLCDIAYCSKKIYIKLSLISLAFISIFGSQFVAKPIMLLNNSSEGWISFMAFAVAGAIFIYGGYYSSILQGTNNIEKQKKLEGIINVFFIIVQISIIESGFDFIWLTTASAIGIISIVIGNKYLLWKLKILKKEKEILKKELHKRINIIIWSATWRAGVGVASNTISYQMIGLLYAQYATPQQVSDLMLAQRLVMIIAQFANVPFYVWLPKFGILYGEGNFKKLIIEARRRMLLTSGLILLMGNVVLLFKDHLYIIGVDNKIGNMVWIILMFGLFVERVGAMHLQLYSLSNDIRWHISNGITAVILLIFVNILPINCGVEALVSSMPVAFICFYVPYNLLLSYKKFNLKFNDIDMIATAPWLIIIIVELIAVLNFNK